MFHSHKIHSQIAHRKDELKLRGRKTQQLNGLRFLLHLKTIYALLAHKSSISNTIQRQERKNTIDGRLTTFAFEFLLDETEKKTEQLLVQ